jgi:hypothetical protein
MNAGRTPLGLRPAAASVLLASLAAACAARSVPPGAVPGTDAEAPTGPAGSGTLSSPAPRADARDPHQAPRAAFPSLPLPGGEEPTPDKALPELSVEPLGMHVGGGKNDAEEKAPFHRALEQKFPAFLDCYRLVDDAWAGGSFGVDLKIPRAGGAPVTEQPRTRIRGAGFQECMLAAFGKVQFEKPKRGPTVISYSVRFTLGKGQH